MTAARRIDAHVHFWKLARGDYGWITPELAPLMRDFGPDDLRPHLAAAGIDAVVLVQAAPTAAETRFLLDIAAAEPLVAGVVGWADMAAPDAPDAVAALAENPRLRGVRPMIQDIPDTDWMLRAEPAPAFRAVAETGLRFDALVKPRHLRNLSRLLERHPDLKTVVDHGAKPDIAGGGFAAWADDIRAVAEGSAALCKLSGLATEAGAGWRADDLRPTIDHLVAVFGPDRLMFGSDWPVLTLAATYEAWLAALAACLSGLDDTALAGIFGGNAARFYGLAAAPA